MSEMQQRYTLEELAAVFNDLLDLPQTARQQWFADSHLHPDDRLQLQRMLTADSDVEPGFLDESAVLHAQALSSEHDRNIEPSDLLGQQFGAFRLTRLLGQGGMATVFSAERVNADFEQTVAVKLLKRGLFSSIEQKLFRRERRLLAQLNHPNIAHLIDGGVTEAGISYLVMEYVDGVRLDQYVAIHRLDLRARLELFIVICGAVESAHQSLIVHRDIKPSNILVTREGVPKLLDFGIAKLLLEDNANDSPYRTLTAALTPGYAAPEQMAGSPITTATDVYALGVVLHELLTGTRPNESDAVLASHAVKLDAIVEPGTLPMPALLLKHALRGDLNNIIARALSAEPEHRYPTSAALIDDLQRYLEGRPVNAHPRSRWYVIRKFARRHYAAVLTGTLVSIALLGLLGTALWQAKQARIEAQRANLVRDFLLDVLDTAKANLPPEQQPTPAALAKKAEERLVSNTDLPDLTRADLLHTLGQVSLSAGAYDQAANMLKQAIAIRISELGPEHIDTLSTYLQLVDTYTRQGKYTEARELLRRTLPILRKRDSSELIDALALCASLEMEAGNIDAAFTCQTEESQTVSRLLDPNSTEALLSKLRFGDMLGAVQRSREAADALQPALSAWRNAGNPTEHADYLTSLNNLAVAYYSLGEFDKAIPIFEQVLHARRKVFPPGHPEIANSLANLGSVLIGAMRYDEAEVMLKEALQITRASLGNVHPTVVIRLIQLSANERRRNHLEAAIRYGRDAIAICSNVEISSSSACLHAQLSLSEALRSTDAKESLHYADLALQQFQAQYKAPDSNIAIALHARAASLFNLQRLSESLDQSEASISMFNALSADESSDALVAKQTRALTLSKLGRHKEAAEVIETVLLSWQEHFPARKDRLLLMLETQVKIQLALGNNKAASASAREALSLKIDESILPNETILLLENAAKKN
jgi:eukaryotic-like serine/threonine-protein kinase